MRLVEALRAPDNRVRLRGLPRERGHPVHALRMAAPDLRGLPCMPRVRGMLPKSLDMVPRSLLRLHPYLEHVQVRLWRGSAPRNVAYPWVRDLGHRRRVQGTVLEGRGGVSCVSNSVTLPESARKTPLAGGSRPGTRRPVRGGRTKPPEVRDR
jgi:hypothetical protein